MSEQELYEIARKRIDRRSRRWTLWAVNLMVLIGSLAGLILFGDTIYETLTLAFFLAVGGVFVFHSIVAAMAETRQGEIEKEVAKLKDAMSRDSSFYEKPKRLELSDDGELVDPEADDYTSPSRSARRG